MLHSHAGGPDTHSSQGVVMFDIWSNIAQVWGYKVEFAESQVKAKQS